MNIHLAREYGAGRQRPGMGDRPRKCVGFRMVGEQPVSPTGVARGQAAGEGEVALAKAIAEGIYRHSSHGHSDGHSRRSTDTIDEQHAAPAPGNGGTTVDVSDSLLSPLDEKSATTETDWRSEAWRGQAQDLGYADGSGDALEKGEGVAAAEEQRQVRAGWFGAIYEHTGSVKQPSPRHAPLRPSIGGLRWSILSGTSSPGSKRSTSAEVSQSWQKARTVLLTQKIVRRSYFSRQIGSIVLHEAPAWMRGKRSRDCVTRSCGLLVLLPIVAAFLTFATSYSLALAFVSWPWLRDGSMPDGCHKSPDWMSGLVEARIQDSLSHVHFPVAVLGGQLHPRADVLGWSVAIRNVTLRRLQIEQFGMAACYDDDRLAFPLLVPARATVMDMRNVSFESSAHFDVYGFLGMYVGSGDAIVTGEGEVRIVTDPMNLRHFVTSCSARFDNDKISLEVSGLGQSLVPSSALPVFLDFESMMCQGRSADALYQFEGPRGFRGMPTEVNAVVLKEVPRIHMLLRLAFLVLATISLAVLCCGFVLRWWVRHFNTRLWGQRTVDFYLGRWLGQDQYRWLQAFSFYTAVLALFCAFGAFLFLSVCYFLTDEQVAYAPAAGLFQQPGGGLRGGLPCHGAGCDMEELPQDVDPMLEEALLSSIPGF